MKKGDRKERSIVRKFVALLSVFIILVIGLISIFLISIEVYFGGVKGYMMADLEWNCHFSRNPPYGDIKVTYTNEDSINRAEIFAISPQKHPIIYPGGKLLLQVNLWSDTTHSIILSIKNSEGAEVGVYSESAFAEDGSKKFPGDGSKNDPYSFKLIFDAPETPGEYALEIYDLQGVLLTKGVIEILDPSITISEVSKEEKCLIDGLEYDFLLEIPYPIIVKPEENGTISLIIKGEDTGKIKELFKNISLTASIRYGHAGDISIKGKEVICSDTECKQEFEVASLGSSSAIIYVWQIVTPEGGTLMAITSKLVTVLDISDLEKIKMRIGNLANAISEYADKIDDKEEAKKWEGVSFKIKLVSPLIGSLIPLLEEEHLKISYVVNMVNVLDDSQEDLEEIINLISDLMEEIKYG